MSVIPLGRNIVSFISLGNFQILRTVFRFFFCVPFFILAVDGVNGHHHEINESALWTGMSRGQLHRLLNNHGIFNVRFSFYFGRIGYAGIVGHNPPCMRISVMSCSSSMLISLSIDILPSIY